MQKLEMNWFHSAKGGVKLQVIDLQTNMTLAVLDRWDFLEMVTINMDVKEPIEVCRYCTAYKGVTIPFFDCTFTVTYDDGVTIHSEFLMQDVQHSDADTLQDLYDMDIENNGNTEKFFAITSQYYNPDNDGKDEAMMFKNIAELPQIKQIIELLRKELVKP